MESRGIRERSIALTASYKDANVSEKGDLKYSSSANNNRGCSELAVIGSKDDTYVNYLIYVKK